MSPGARGGAGPLRHLLSVLVLPVTMTLLVPAWILRDEGVPLSLPASLAGWGVAGAGCVGLVAGALLVAGSMRRFGREGRGTLAPWDPPSELVVTGAYAHVRNPMISGVVLILLGQAGLARSTALVAWAVIFAAANALYIPLVEERGLRARFGGAYDVYARNVPRLIPRRRPWRPPASGDAP